MKHIDFDSAILAARFCDGGHEVNGEEANALPAALAEPAPPPRVRFHLFPRTPEGQGRLIGAVLGVAGACLITGRFFGAF